MTMLMRTAWWRYMSCLSLYPLNQSTNDAVKVLKGEIRETRFAIPRNPGKDGPLVETSNLKFGLNKVAYMADEVSSLSKFRFSSRADLIFSLVFIPSPILIRLNMLSLFIVSTTAWREILPVIDNLKSIFHRMLRWEDVRSMISRTEGCSMWSRDHMIL